MSELDVVLAPVLLLGALHGINPAMGWLFAVSLGLQEESGRAVWRALGPLAVGHALSIVAVLVVAAVLGMVIPMTVLKWVCAAALLGFGMFHLVRHRHPRFGGMTVGRRDLTIWSFLVASAHGAGLMVLPFVLKATSPVVHAHGHASHASHASHAVAGGSDLAGILAAVVHTAGYLATAGVVALVVYHRLGLRLLRTAWINLNLIWAGTLIVTAVLIPFL